MVEKTRYSVTLTKPFMDGLKELVDRGLYLDNQTAIRMALRDLFEKHGVRVFQDMRHKK